MTGSHAGASLEREGQLFPFLPPLSGVIWQPQLAVGRPAGSRLLWMLEQQSRSVLPNMAQPPPGPAVLKLTGAREALTLREPLLFTGSVTGSLLFHCSAYQGPSKCLWKICVMKEAGVGFRYFCTKSSLLYYLKERYLLER